MTDFTDQLTASPYVLDARHEPRVAAAWSGDGGPTPGAVLLSRAHDSELDAVSTLLTRVNIPNLRINADHLDDVEVMLDPAGGYIGLNGRRIAPMVTWIRHFAATAIACAGRPVADQFIRESWAATASQLAQMSAVTIAAARPGILTQQRLAAQHQIAVPRTLLTNDLPRAARLIGSRRLVIKAAHQHFVEAEPGLLSGVFPVVVSSQRLTGQIAPDGPVIVQEYVEHDTELRVYYVDGQLQTFDVGKATPADPWLAPDRVTARLVPPPPAVAWSAQRLAEAMSLRYAAFDFLLRDRSVIFLEVNPDGDWLWLEAKSGQHPVTAAVGRMLSGLHYANCSRSPPFNLLAFLSADGGPGGYRLFIRAVQAACRYSWRVPLSRSRLRTSSYATWRGRCAL
jgi:hypothetical protein